MYSVSGRENGKATLISATNSYFESCPDGQSNLAAIIDSRDRVIAV